MPDREILNTYYSSINHVESHIQLPRITYRSVLITRSKTYLGHFFCLGFFIPEISQIQYLY